MISSITSGSGPAASRCSNRGVRAARRSILTALIAFVIISAVVAVTISGCGSDARMNAYIQMAKQVLADVNAKVVEVRKYWTMSFAQSADMQSDVAALRRVLAKVEDKLDTVDPPEKAQKLEGLLRRVVNTGDDIAKRSTPFGDYLASVSPITTQFAEIVGSLAALSESKDVPSDVAGMTEKVSNLEAQLRSIVPPPEFLGIHQEYQKFMQNMLAAFEDASRGTGAGGGTQDSSDEETDSEEPESTSGSRSRKSTPVPALEDVPQRWAGFDGEMTALLAELRQSSGLKTKSDEYVSLVGLSLEEIKNLEKKK